MKNSRTSFFRRICRIPKKNSKRNVPTETELAAKEMLRVVKKLDRSWRNFLYANEKYIDIAVMEIYHNEMEHSILYNKILQLNDKRDEKKNIISNTRHYLPWLEKDFDSKEADNEGIL